MHLTFVVNEPKYNRMHINFILDPSTTVQFEEDQFLSKAFFWATLVFLAWLIFA